MTDQARKRAEEYFVREWDVIDLMSRDYIIDSHIDGQKVGHASALEEIGKVGVEGARKWFIDKKNSHAYDKPHQFEPLGFYEVIEAAPALLEIATLKAQLEKCKEQRNEALEKFNYDNLHVEKSMFYKTEVSRLDTELEDLK